MSVLGPNQLWVADITYIRLTREFVYLAVVLDAFSRKVIGWALGRSLKAQLPVCALGRAIANRRPQPGVVHHSDQGVQYASREYLQKLKEHGMLPSMSRPANPYDNATCESFLKTLKREEIYANTYRDFEEPAGVRGGIHRTVLQRVSITLGARIQFTGKVRKRLPNGIRESLRGGDNDVLRCMMRVLYKAKTPRIGV